MSMVHRGRIPTPHISLHRFPPLGSGDNRPDGTNKQPLAQRSCVGQDTPTARPRSIWVPFWATRKLKRNLKWMLFLDMFGRLGSFKAPTSGVFMSNGCSCFYWLFQSYGERHHPQAMFGLGTVVAHVSGSMLQVTSAFPVQPSRHCQMPPSGMLVIAISSYPTLAAGAGQPQTKPRSNWSLAQTTWNTLSFKCNVALLSLLSY